ncbi:MAG: hypothetical protein COV35_02440 [Alphaproteobacteria bacterium CG11_big_fil_rev_8_21_14_0_20_39_49]|nr:MAG: hypothetical protein COV35_02440 [Alphaproteobacteria bacterium CG11_big_fil_rev_8_21_14_0_20_39_49]
MKFLFSVTAILFVINPIALANVGGGDFNAEIISYNIKSAQSRSTFDPKIGFEIKVTHPSYKILDANLNKTKVTEIYQKGKYVNGKFLYGKTDINILDSVQQPNPDCDYCKNLSSGRFSISPIIDNSLYLKYENNSVQIDDIYNYNVRADIYTKVTDGNEKEAVIDDVVLKITDLDISEIAKRNISRFSKDITNDEVNFTLKEDGSKGGSNNQMYYGYKIVNNNEEQYISSLSVIDGDKEVFLDQKSYGGPMKTLSGNNDSAYLPEQYLNKPLKIKVYYFDTKEHLVRVNQDLRKE